MNKSQRMQFKAMICVLGILLLMVLFTVGIILGFVIKEPEYIPVVRELKNVWVMEVEETGLRVFEDGVERSFAFCEGVSVPSRCREQVADITLKDERVSQIICKTHKVNGKVLSVDVGGVELEGAGYLPFAPDVKGYRLYDELSMWGRQDIMIGYDFTDFVVQDQMICGILAVREEAMEYIRVLIRTRDYQGLLHDTIALSCDTDYSIEYGPYDQRMEAAYKAGEVCTLTGDSTWFESDRIRIVPAVLTGKVILQNVSRSQGTAAYRGTMEVVKHEKGLAVINEVPLEEYLYSVVPSEMPASYPREALKAQAMCARTYAYQHMLHAGLAAYGAHVDDSTNYQVYNNIVEQEAATTAVKETYGQILFTGEDTLAETYYYSTSCGIGSDGDVWGTQVGVSPSYLAPRPISRIVPEGEDVLLQAKVLQDEDNFSEFIHSKNEQDYEASESWYRWTYTVSQLDAEKLRERLIDRYKANPERVLTENKNGVYESSPIGEWKTVKNISIVRRGAGGVASELVIETQKDTYKVLTQYNIRYILCDTQSYVVRQDGKKVKAASILPSAFLVMELLMEEGHVAGYFIHGGGYGHGVGMSQNGARNMAQEGMSAEEILTFFYQGCYVGSIYE